MIKTIVTRLRSPVVIVQIITILGSLAVTLIPECKGFIDNLVYTITVIVNLFAGLNNPEKRDHF